MGPILAQSHLDLLLPVWAWFILAQQFGLVGVLVSLEVLPVPLDVGPGPHLNATLNVDLHDAVEAVPPPGRSRKVTPLLLIQTSLQVQQFYTDPVLHTASESVLLKPLPEPEDPVEINNYTTKWSVITRTSDSLPREQLRAFLRDWFKN